MRGPTPRRKKEFSGRLNQWARDVEPSHQWPSRQSGEPATNPQSAPRTLPPPQAAGVTFEKHFEVRFRTTYETFHFRAICHLRVPFDPSPTHVLSKCTYPRSRSRRL